MTRQIGSIRLPGMSLPLLPWQSLCPPGVYPTARMALAYALNATAIIVPPGLLGNGGQGSSLVGGSVAHALARLVAQACPDQPREPAPGSCGRGKRPTLLTSTARGLRQTADPGPGLGIPVRRQARRLMTCHDHESPGCVRHGLLRPARGSNKPPQLLSACTS